MTQNEIARDGTLRLKKKKDEANVMHIFGKF